MRIDIPTARCRAGSTIAGTVSLQGDVDIDVDVLTISLSGRSKTKSTRSQGNSSATYRGRAPLFYQTQTLFQGPHTIHSNHEWSFAFTLPDRCNARHRDAFKDRVGGFNLDPSQSLPPTFDSENISFGWHARCFITYELEANLVRNKTFARDICETRRLNFYTTRDGERPDPQFRKLSRHIVCSSPALQPGLEDTPLPFKDRLKGLYSSKHPVAKFTLNLVTPCIVAVEQSCPFYLEVDHDIEALPQTRP